MEPATISENIFTEFKQVYNTGSDPLVEELFTELEIKKINKTKRTCTIGFQFENSERKSLGVSSYVLERNFSMPISLWTPVEQPVVNNTILMGAFQIFFEKRNFQGVSKKSTSSFKPVFDQTSQMIFSQINFYFSVSNDILSLSEIPTIRTFQKNVVTPSFDRNLRTESDEKLQTESNQDLLREEDAEV